MHDYLSQYKGKTILITGGAGCIGSNLTRALAELEVEKILVLDDLSSSYRWNVPDHHKVSFIQGSILDEEVLKSVFLQEPQYIFHLAALFANQNSIDHPQKDLLVNGLGTLKLLQYARLTKIEKFLFASSGCSVYGSHAPLPFKEDYVCIELDTPYQITKLLGELYCNLYHSLYGLPVVRARFFNVYGPAEVPGKYRNVIPNFIYLALRGQPLPITGTGEETRDFTFVEDIVDGTLRAAVVPGAVGQALNLASGTETTILTIADTINELVGNSAEVEFRPKRDWDKSTRRRASIQKAASILGYQPAVEIKPGIQQTIDWFQENRERIEASADF